MLQSLRRLDFFGFLLLADGNLCLNTTFRIQGLIKSESIALPEFFPKRVADLDCCDADNFLQGILLSVIRPSDITDNKDNL